jgi:tryptophanyl-tRNA synthetase
MAAERGPGAATPARRPRVFSGIQPSGDVHLGNYLGAIKRWAAGQREKENYFCVVDLHSLTLPQDPELLRHQTRSLAAVLLAAGLDPTQCTLFVQSHVSAHAEACWLLNCVTPLGWLQRMTQYKDRVARHESVGMGILDYPVLMAADIPSTTPTRCRWERTSSSTWSSRATSPSGGTASTASSSSCRPP